ncbi:hypothetical protein LXL04_038684 [Taraxacum kok-saghyz]
MDSYNITASFFTDHLFKRASRSAFFRSADQKSCHQARTHRHTSAHSIIQVKNGNIIFSYNSERCIGVVDECQHSRQHELEIINQLKANINNKVCASCSSAASKDANFVAAMIVQNNSMLPFQQDNDSAENFGGIAESIICIRRVHVLSICIENKVGYRKIQSGLQWKLARMNQSEVDELLRIRKKGPLNDQAIELNFLIPEIELQYGLMPLVNDQDVIYKGQMAQLKDLQRTRGDK